MMSEANVQRARRGFEAAARGDLDTLREILDPDVRGHGPDGPGEESCHDRDQTLRFIELAISRGALGELVDVIDAGDQVIVVMRGGGDPGRDQSEQHANLTTFRKGRVVEMIAYETPEQARAAARV